MRHLQEITLTYPQESCLGTSLIDVVGHGYLKMSLITLTFKNTLETLIKGPLLSSRAECLNNKAEIYVGDEGLGIKELLFMLFFFKKKRL